MTARCACEFGFPVRRHGVLCPWQVAPVTPTCSEHGRSRMVWQDSWGAPGWVCGACLESSVEGDDE